MKMNFNPVAAVSVLINHNHHLSNNSNINGSLAISHNNNNNNNNSISINNNHNNINSNNSDSENFIQFDSPLTAATTNHLKSMEWTNDDALELIEQYRGHTELWNRADPKYKDKLCRFRAWSEIAERFGCSKAEVERKMNVLLTQYRREKHKILVKLYQGIQPSPSKWYAFKRFDFMEAGSIPGAMVGGSGSGSSGLRIRSEGSTSSGNANVLTGGSGAVVDSVRLGSGTNGHTIAAAALNELRNFETTSAVAAAAAAAAASSSSSSCPSTTTAAVSSHHHHHHQHHHHPQAHRQRFKAKEMKYFGAMGLNLPMLIANTPTLDSWNSVGQFSPPIVSGERVGHLRVPLPLPFSGPPTEIGVTSTPGRSIFGGSSSSEHTASPQKPMETVEIDIDERDVKHEPLRNVGGTIDDTETGDQQSLHPQSDAGSKADDNPTGVSSDASGLEPCESKTSPIPNPANTHEAHISSRKPHTQQQYPLHRHLDTRSDHEDVDIKEEMIDYFHAPNPPAPPGSHRSYSSNEERLGGAGAGTDSDDFAQDLRISAAAAVAAAAKGLDFRRFVLPRNQRRSTDSNGDEEKFTPLNMRKLSNASAAGITTTPAATSAGQMLMSTLLSHESLSNDTTASGRGGGGVKSEASTSAAAAAAALYAESLNRDDCDFVGSNVSLKLRAMDRDQRIIAEKLISEVLFFGQFNELERSARIQPK